MEATDKGKLARISPGVKWESLSGSIIKINFDCAFHFSSSRSIARVVAKDLNGEVLFSGSSIHVNIPTSFAMEAIACIKAVQMAKTQGCSDIQVEGDSLVIIKKRQANDLDKSLLTAYIHEIQSLKSSSQAIEFIHVPRSANTLAHIIAKESMRREEAFYLIGGVPPFAERVMVVDRCREPD